MDNIVTHHIDDYLIEHRLRDGYINAYSLCKAAGKDFNNYAYSADTKAFVEALSSEVGIPTSALIQTVTEGDRELRGTWVHPQIAIHLAQWASPKLAVLAYKWVSEWQIALHLSQWMTPGRTNLVSKFMFECMNGCEITDKRKLPYHFQWYMKNRAKMPPSHFSIFTKIMYLLIEPLECLGYELPDSMVPDILEGRIFDRWLRDEKGLDPNDFPTYDHECPDGRIITGVKLYPNYLGGDLNRYFYCTWIREKAEDYFRSRDKTALPYLKTIVSRLRPVSDYIF